MRKELINIIEDCLFISNGEIKPAEYLSTSERKELNKLYLKLTKKLIPRTKVKIQIHKCINILLKYAQHNYTSTIDIQDLEDDIFKELATGINCLGEELNYSTVTKYYLEDIFNSMEDMLFVVDRKFTIQSINTSVTKTLKFTHNEIIGENLKSFIHNFSKQKEILINHTKKHQRVNNVKLLTSEKKKVNVILNISTFVRGNNSKIGWLITARNIEEILKYQKYIEEQNREITKQNQTLLVTNEHLIEAKNIAEQVNKIKSMFLANMSHEIRTPLNGILGMISLLNRSELSEQQQFHLDIMKSTSTQLLNVVNDVLDFSKIEANKMTLLNAPFNFREMTNDVINMFKLTVQHKNIDLKLILETTIEESYLGDKMRIQQILNNLISNAIKFTEVGYVSITIEKTRSTKKYDSLNFIIEDSGIGIPPERLEFIFDAFTQLEQHNTKRHQGTGIGLTITKDLIKKMGGKISVKSTINQGTTFNFNLDLLKHN